MQNFIKKILAVVLASILILGLLPGIVAEETKTPVINCYDFDLRFHLEADTFIVDFDRDPDFEVVSVSEPVTENGITFRFVVYEKK